MLRLHTTFDLLEGHTLTALLREHGIAAWLFDADFVRLNWFEMLAYGGYRVMVQDDCWAAARELLSEYKNGQLTATAEPVTCTHCGHVSAQDDPQPRRNVFLAMIALPVVGFIVLPHWKLTHGQFLAAFFVQIFLYATVPWLLIRYFKWRMRCADCGRRWRQPPAQRHAELSRLAEAGDTPAVAAPT